LVGNGGSDEIWGADGDDLMIADDDGSQYDRYEGGAGSDTISYERLGHGVSVDFRIANPYAWGDDWKYVFGDAVQAENITGTAYRDWIFGDVADNVLKGGAGDDDLHGGGGNDVLEGGAGADHLNGWEGINTASYASSSAGVYVDLSTGEAFGGDAEGDAIFNVGRLRGSKLADQLKGDQYDNTLEGGAGDDWLVATAGSDTFDGGEGKDFVDYSEVTAGVTLTLGGYTPTSAYSGYGSGGLATNHVYTAVEGVVGSAYADTLSAGDGDQTFVGGAGNDWLAGGAGADTYVFSRGDGFDIIDEDNTGWNVLSIGEGVTFSDLWIETLGSPTWLTVGIRGTADSIRTINNFTVAANNKLKSIDMNGAGQLDIGSVTYAVAGDDNANSLNGGANRGDMIFGNNGADTITGSGTTWEDKGNVVVGGLGNDAITTSGGDDQFAYDRGDGQDSINDSGGEDTIVFGSTASAEDVIYEVVRRNPGSTIDFTADLYVALKDASDPNRRASQVADRIRIEDGGTRYQNYWDNQFVSETLNTVEFVVAGGTSIDLRKLDINWSAQRVDNYSNYSPIALDLDGDGLNLSTVEASNVVVKTTQGGLSKIGWVGPTDGFLAVDRDGDGAINRLSEISFVQDKPGATSDLEGLRTWDTNGDGLLDKNDANFSKILLFVDANQNGRSTSKELRTLEEAGIKAINLGGTATGYTGSSTIDSFVQNTVSFVWADGRTGEGYDVALARRVLGSEGLYAGEYQAEWGARDEDGTLGQLLNDPKTAAKAARIKAKKGLLDKLGASYAEVKAAAQLDFSDHDKVDAKIAQRWKKMDASQQAAWLSGQATGMDGQQNLAALKAISSGEARANALNASVRAGQDLVAHGLTQAGAEVSTEASDQLDGVDQTMAGGLSGEFGATTSLGGLGGGLTSSQPLDGVVAAGAAIGQDQAWWRGPADGGLAGAGSLAALLATMDQGAGQASPSALSGTDDPALLQQQMLLRQAMAGFGGQAGGLAAVWNRDMTQASTVLAASGQTKTPSAFGLALTS